MKACQTAADCKRDNGAYDADNHACISDKCVYLGCKTDAKCATTFSDPAWVCGEGNFSSVPVCVRACQTVADCKRDSGAYDADNHACTSGKCVYLGCKMNAKCAATFSDPTWVCGD